MMGKKWAIRPLLGGGGGIVRRRGRGGGGHTTQQQQSGYFYLDQLPARSCGTWIGGCEAMHQDDWSAHLLNQTQKLCRPMSYASWGVFFFLSSLFE